MLDRTSRPTTVAVQVPAERMSVIAALRRLRMTGPQIAEALTMPLSTVGVVLRRLGMEKLKNL